MLINQDTAPLTSTQSSPDPSTMPENPLRSAPVRGKRYMGLVIVAIGTLCGVTAFMVGARNFHILEPAAAEHNESRGSIKCIPVTTEEKVSEISLPADIQAMQSSRIFARVNGYLKTRKVDIGAPVTKGEIIAEIDTPELDQQLAEAEAQLVQAQANVQNAEAMYRKSLTDMESVKSSIVRNEATVRFAQATYQRWQVLQQEGAVSKQDRDSQLTSWQTGNADLSSSISAKASADAQIAAYKAAIAVAKANEKSIKERVRELQVTQQFKNVAAPFDGTITNRLVDPGQLISSGGGQGSTELFDIVDQRRLRIYVQVPERDIAALKEGMPVDISVETFPHKVFIGTMTNIAGALDPATRTMQVEVQMDNSSKQLHAGMFASAKLTMPNDDRSAIVPASSIVIRDADTCVQLLGRDGKLHWQHVTVSKELGKTTVLASGVKKGDYIVASPSEDYMTNKSLVPVKEPSL
jgi:RND family efflux transporter MFP subunit